MTRDHVIVTWASGNGLRTTAIALYERLGFIVTESWDSRDDLVCMEHAFGGGGEA
ncbi:hypothetical protein ACFYYP_01710 [Microbispora rosea]|uniref:hypothetical protein n=1 Tax=Microbispora rosea TaxID=58117 RepID=UPI00369B5049